MRCSLIALILASLAGPALAQHQPPSPYAGLETRQIKALSEAQIADLKNGRGAGLALAAELNGYPGPIHVLELAEPLGLTSEQRQMMESLLAAMRAEAIPLGEKLIEQEATLEHQFVSRSVSKVGLEHLTQEIGRTQAALRAAHLRYHLVTLEGLTAAQARRYTELRGYAVHSAEHHHRAH